MAGKVGFVGLGIMGRPMAENLLRDGHELVLFNRTRQKAKDLARGNRAEVAGSPGEVAEGSDVVVTMLPGPPDVERIFAGEGGLIEKANPGTLLIDMSTSSPVLARDLARKAEERDIGVLDAPVSGGDVGAQGGTLSIMAGGSEEDFAKAEPLFRAMGTTVTHVGPAGAGQVAKACNQIVVALVMEAVAEALVLSSTAGVATEKVLDVLSGGSAKSKVIEVKREKYLDHAFEPGGKVEFHHKDLGIALAAGREYGVPLPVTAMVDSMFEALKAKGRGGWDHSALVTLIEDWSGRGAEDQTA